MQPRQNVIRLNWFAFLSKVALNSGTAKDDFI
jgi:hypothetical protein